MKNAIKYFALLFLTCFMVVGCNSKKEEPTPVDPQGEVEDPVDPVDPQGEVEDPVDPVDPVDPPVEESDLVKHLIKNPDGSYGGSLNESLYGKGTPLNGELDHPDTIYYKINNYYNCLSTETRTIINNFEPYVETTKFGDGISCALMWFNHFGLDVQDELNEEKLHEEYERISGDTIKTKGCKGDYLVTLFENHGVAAEWTKFDFNGVTGTEKRTLEVTNLVRDTLKDGCGIMVDFQKGIDHQWINIIGVDDMGTKTYGADDVLICADPYDVFDHYQDGYYTLASKALYGFWLNTKEIELNSDKSGIVFNNRYKFIKVKPGKNMNQIDVSKKGPETLKRSVEEFPERHLLLNADGSFGGSYLKANHDVAEGYGTYGEYGYTEKNGKYYDDPTQSLEHEDTVYWKMPEYYNLGQNESRVLLNHYRQFEQTMDSTCGICSCVSAMAYFGWDFTPKAVKWADKTKDYSTKEIGEYKFMRSCEVNRGITIKGNGIGNSNLRKTLEEYGFKIWASNSYSMTSYLKGNASRPWETVTSLENDCRKYIGEKRIPMPFCWRVGGGHWEVMIGFDDMGTDTVKDDVMILADPHDVNDHYQDGYQTWAAEWVWAHMYNGGSTTNQQHVFFSPSDWTGEIK